MRVYVLGAGASAHAGYPLASQLGVSIASWVDGLPPDHHYHEQLAHLRRVYGSLDDFEHLLTDLMGDAPVREGPVSRSTLIGMLQDALWEYFNAIRDQPAPYYDQLAQRIRHGDVVLTFNYDLGIERSLKAAGLWHINDGYGFRITPEPARSPVRVLKLHGSTNWRGLLFGGSTGYGHATNSLGDRPILFFRPDLAYIGFPEFCDPQCANLKEAVTTNALIMPVLKKQFYHETSFGSEWKRFWDMLWIQAASAFRQADEILMIGYSMPPADERARELLFTAPKRDAHLTICAHSATARIAAEFRAHALTDVHEPDSPTFEGWLSS